MVEKLYNFGSSLFNSCFSISGEKIKLAKVQRKQKLKTTWWGACGLFTKITW
jgi:hypothetical protein